MPGRLPTVLVIVLVRLVSFPITTRTPFSIPTKSRDPDHDPIPIPITITITIMSTIWGDAPPVAG